MSPTTRNTLFNKRITAPRRTIIEVRVNSDSEESDDEVAVVVKGKEMKSVHHPVTPRTGFFPGFRVEKQSAGGLRKSSKGKAAGRKVGFAEEVVVHILVADKEEEDVEMKE